MYVPGAAVAIAAMAVMPGNLCRGRCLLQNDGTLDIEAPSTGFGNATSHKISFVNSSQGPPAHELIPEMLNTTGLHPSHLDLAIDTSKPPANMSSALPALNASLAGSTSAPLVCGCNCTYVSAGCCLSKTIWESHSQQIQMQPLPANASVYCDTRSGGWVSKPSNNSSNGKVNVGFVELGSVSFSPDAAISNVPTGLIAKS